MWKQLLHSKKFLVLLVSAAGTVVAMSCGTLGAQEGLYILLGHVGVWAGVQGMADFGKEAVKPKAGRK